MLHENTLKKERVESAIFRYNEKLYFKKSFIQEIIDSIIQLKSERNLEKFILFLENLLSDIDSSMLDKEVSSFPLAKKEEIQLESDKQSQSSETTIVLSSLYNELGHAYFFKDEPLPAKKNLDKACEYNPNNISALHNRADLEFNTKAFEKSIEDCTKVLSMKEDYVPVVYLAGLNYSCLGKPEEALSYFQRTVELDPNSIGGNFWAGECLLHLQRYEEALPYFEKNKDLKKIHNDSLRGLAICYLSLSKPKEAIEMCDKMLETNPYNQLGAYQIKGDAFILAQEFEDAAYFHTELAKQELDAREIIVNKAKYILENFGKESAYRYIKSVLMSIPDMANAFKFMENTFHIPTYNEKKD